MKMRQILRSWIEDLEAGEVGESVDHYKNGGH